MNGFKLKTLAGTVVLASIIPVIAQESEVNGSNPLFSIPSLEAARQNHNNSVPQTTNSSTEVTTRTLVDPMLENLKPNRKRISSRLRLKS